MTMSTRRKPNEAPVLTEKVLRDKKFLETTTVLARETKHALLGMTGAVAANSEASTVSLATSDEVMEELAEDFEAPATPDAVCVLVAQAARLRSVVRPALQAELDRLLDVAGDLFEREGEDMTVQPEFVAAYARRRARLPTETLVRLDAWLTRLARHLVFTEIVMRPREIVACVRELIVRVATIHFLCVIHPGAAVPDDDDLADWIVRLVQGAARVMDHDLNVKAFLAGDAKDLLPSLAALQGMLAFV